jgi:hypothetical protein|tara:strand:+ start:491 stop:1156 length:666 start_codon:yes stop_codon:yes gene_type:complete
MSAIIETKKQDWDVKIYNQKKECPYLVIDNWYTQDELSAVWHELNMYLSQPKYEKADDKGSAVARDSKGAKSNAFRFHLWDNYTPKGRDLSPILRSMYKQRTKEFHNIVLEAMPLHHNNLVNTNKDSTFIGYYDKDQYYKPHHDSVQFTCLIWMHKEPKKFFGGNTKLVPIDATIECIPNRMLFFPSYIEHEVTTLKCKENIPYGYGRFGITHFYNWESNV